MIWWLQSVLGPAQELYADLDALNFRPVRDLFKSFRPDIAIVEASIYYSHLGTNCMPGIKLRFLKTLQTKY